MNLPNGTHRCACGRTYSDDAWHALPPARGGAEMLYSPGLLQEYRNCACGSTMASDPLPPVLSLLSASEAA